MSLRWTALLVTLIGAVLVPTQARAERCGEAACGAHGRCQLQSLLAHCDCEPGYVSVTTYLGGGSQGATCVVIPARPDEALCEGWACGPHGVCVVEETAERSARCVCDPGYRWDGALACVDVPEDRAEEVCLDVLCGENATCMATDDAVTCRCRNGEYVVLGLTEAGELGPVCQAPANPETACGPQQCGPLGECVISQAIFCLCDVGARRVEERSGGRNVVLCLDPGVGESDAGSSDADRHRSDLGVDGDAALPPGKVLDGGCHCTLAQMNSGFSGVRWLWQFFAGR